MKPDPFRVVPMNVARNPVARAVARKMLTDALRNFQLRIYLMRDGEDASGDVEAAAKSLTVTCRGLELAGRVDDPAVAVMRGALSALQQCARRRFKWRTDDAVAIDRGLQLVSELYPKLNPAHMAQAWQELRKLEQRIARQAVTA